MRELLCRSDTITTREKLAIITDQFEMRQYFLLFQNLGLFFLKDDPIVVLLLIGEIREFEFMSNKSSLEFSGKWFVFEGFSPNLFFRIGTG